MIETLSLAAEITAALLLISLAIPRRKRTEQESDGSAVSHETLRESESSLEALQLFSLMSIGRRVTSEMKRGRRLSQVVQQHGERLINVWYGVQPLLTSTSFDGLTGLRDRRSVESLVEFATELALAQQASYRIVLFQIDSLAEAEDIHGPVGAEKVIRQTAIDIERQIGGCGIAFRSSYQTFGILSADIDFGVLKELAEDVRAHLSEQAIVINDEHTARISMSAALFSMDLSKELSEAWEAGEEGLATCLASGGGHGRWFDAATSTWRPFSESAPQTSVDSVADPSLGEESSEIGSVNDDVSISVAEEVGSQAESTATASDFATDRVSTSSTSSSSNGADESISADDLAALFFAAKTHALANPAETAVATSTNGNPIVAPEPLEEDRDVQVTKDDISDLFNTVKKGVAPLPPDKQDLKKMPIQAELEELKVPALKTEVDRAATEEDIQALFAAFKK